MENYFVEDFVDEIAAKIALSWPLTPMRAAAFDEGAQAARGAAWVDESFGEPHVTFDQIANPYRG